MTGFMQCGVGEKPPGVNYNGVHAVWSGEKPNDVTCDRVHAVWSGGRAQEGPKVPQALCDYHIPGTMQKYVPVK